MTDSYQSALAKITRILKAAPGLPTVENLLRLASIYKFETFREGIENSLSRISIAGQILVIDIDFEERPTNVKGQTRFHLHSAKLILANNEASFKDVNSATGENVLKNALMLYPDLSRFDLCLERLATIDQHSVLAQGELKLDCFEFMTFATKYFEEVFDGEVLVNPADEFALEILGKFKIYLVTDEKMSLNMYSLKDGNLLKRLPGDGGPAVLNDVGFRVEILNGKTLPILKHLLREFNIEADGEEKLEIPSVNDTFKTKRYGTSTTIQLFYVFQSDLVSISSFKGGDILNVIEVMKALLKYDELFKITELIKGKCALVDRFAEMETDAARLSEFLAKQSGSVEDKMDVDHGFLTLTASEEAFEVQGSYENLTRRAQINNDLFVSEVAQIRSQIDTEIL